MILRLLCTWARLVSPLTLAKPLIYEGRKANAVCRVSRVEVGA